MIASDPKVSLGQYLQTYASSSQAEKITSLITNKISICTMNETLVTVHGGNVNESSGNPTEIALLTLVEQFGRDYQKNRNTTPGRTGIGELSARFHQGKLLNFTSSRKLTSWIVPLENGAGVADYMLRVLLKL